MPEMERWRRSGRQTAFRDIELVDLGPKPECLEFLIKVSLDRIPVVAPLMMMVNNYIKAITQPYLFHELGTMDHNVLRALNCNGVFGKAVKFCDYPTSDVSSPI